MPRTPASFGIPLLVGVVYAALYWLIDASAAFDTSLGSAFWPQAGVTLAVLLLRPRREWPAILLVVLAVETVLDLTLGGYRADVSLIMGLANTVEPLVGAVLLQRLARGVPDLATRSGLLAFVAAAVVAGPAAGALIGSAGPALLGVDPLFPRLPRWFVGDAIGVLVVAPAVLVVALPGLRPGRGALVPLGAVAAIALAVLGPWDAPTDAGLPFLVLPLLAVVAIRLGLTGAALGVLIVAAVVEGFSVVGQGPFAHTGAFGGLIVVQMFLAMASLTTLTIAVLVKDLVGRDEVAATLRAQALHDSLTGLANRRLLFDRLEQAGLRLARRDGAIALFYVDLDGFKHINDRHGHLAGDHVLQRTAERLLASVRAEDTVARIGGDEFVVLVEGDGDPAEVDALAQRLVRACEAPVDWQGEPLEIGASVGVAVSTGPVADVDRLVGAADRAMYGAKRAGGRRAAVQAVAAV